MHIFLIGGGILIDISFEKKLVIDSKRNVWLFYPMASGKTGYVVKHSRGEVVSGQPVMDETVMEYDIMVDERDNIHIVALTAGQRVVYTRHDSRGWTKQTLYSFGGESIGISGLKVVKDTGGLHLFYVYSDKGGGCALFHHRWNGNEWRGHRVFDVPGKEGNICYDCGMGGDNRLSIAAVEGKNFSLWDFDGAKWTISASKAGSAWERAAYMEFREGSIMLRNDGGVFFVRKARDMRDASLQEIIEGRHVDEGPVLINRRNTLYIAWIEGGSLGYRASYDGGSSWGRVKYYHHVQGKQLEVYGFASTYSLLIDARRIIATAPPEIHVPFLHRSVERIRMPEVSLGEPEERIAGTDVAGTDDVYQGTRPYESEQDFAGEKAQDRSASDSGEKNGGPLLEDEGEGPYAIEKIELEKVKEDLNALRHRMETDIIERLDRLDLEVADLKGKQKDTEKGSNFSSPAGSIITQDMINRYFKKR